MCMLGLMVIIIQPDRNLGHAIYPSMVHHGLGGPHKVNWPSNSTCCSNLIIIPLIIFLCCLVAKISLMTFYWGSWGHLNGSNQRRRHTTNETN